jgi:hypothetical protein
LITEGLRSAGRADLIGTGNECLVASEDRANRQFLTKYHGTKK